MKTEVVLITGGSAGIGLATAKILMERGVCVYAASRSGGTDEQAPSGGKIVHLKMDVTKAPDVERAVSQILLEQHRLDAVVCNAGNGLAGAIEGSSDEEQRYQFETCLFGVLKTIQACLPIFRRQGYGRIVTVSSVAGIVPIPFQALYSSVKSALITLTKALQVEVAPYGIACCCLLPGDTKTEFTTSRKYTKESQLPDSPYYKRFQNSVGKMEQDEVQGMPSEKIGKAIVRELLAKRMRLVVVPGLDYKLYALLVRLLPNRVLMKIVGMLYG